MGTDSCAIAGVAASAGSASAAASRRVRERIQVPPKQFALRATLKDATAGPFRAASPDLSHCSSLSSGFGDRDQVISLMYIGVY
jgi:hypothetical protein